MKRFTFISLLIFAFALAAISQNQNGIVDDVYFNPKDQKAQLTNSNQVSPNQITENKQRPNYKNGAQEIIFKERNIKNPTILRDTVYVIGQASDYNTNSNNGDFNLSKWDGKTNPVILHDTIYVTDNLNDSVYISQDNNSNPDKGYYLNGFNGTESDKEYAERIRRFHNPKYSIFIGDPRYNDIYFLNSSDWNVYVDDSYAYVTPTWTNPYWWNYNYGPMGFGSYGFGWHSPYYGFGNIYNPWGYDNFYGYGGMYGYGNYWDLYGYGYGGYYGGYSGYGSYWSTSRNKNYNEGTRRSLATQNNESGRLNTGTRSGTSNAVINAGGYNSRGSGNAYTVVSGTNSNSTISSGVASRSVLNSNSRTISNQSNGIGIVRNNTNRNSGNYQSTGNGYSFNRTENINVNTRPRTYTTTTTGETNGNYISRVTNSSTSTFRGSSSSITRSVTSNTPSTYSNNSRNSYSESSSNSRSSANVNSSQTNSSSSSYNSGNSGSSSNSSSSGSGRTNSSSGGRR
jgi:hypothetical protein